MIPALHHPVQGRVFCLRGAVVYFRKHMAKFGLSSGGGFEGGAARKLEQTPQEPSGRTYLPRKQTKEPAAAAPEKAEEFFLPLTKEERSRYRAEKSKGSSKRLREKMETVAESEAAKQAARRELERDTVPAREVYTIVPPPEVYEAVKKAHALLEKRRIVSLEEARQLLPHGDRTWQLINKKLEEEADTSSLGAYAIASELGPDPKLTGRNYDLASEYLRELGRYRRLVDLKDNAGRREALQKMMRMSHGLGVVTNAEVQQYLEPEDILHIQEQIDTDTKAYTANELKNLSKELASLPMSVEHVKNQGGSKEKPQPLVKRAEEIWDLVADSLPEEDRGLATEYVFALARVNQASRAVDAKAYERAWSTFAKMNAALGIEGNALIQSEILPRPAEEYRNPFTA